MRIALAALAVALLAGVGWWIAEEARYKEASELARQPYPLRRIDLEPADSGGLEYFGKLRIDIYIGADGKSDRVVVVSSTLPGKFVEHAVQALARTTWEPGVRWGRKVRSRKVVELEIEPPAPLGRPPMRPES